MSSRDNNVPGGAPVAAPQTARRIGAGGGGGANRVWWAFVAVAVLIVGVFVAGMAFDGFEVKDLHAFLGGGTTSPTSPPNSASPEPGAKSERAGAGDTDGGDGNGDGPSSESGADGEDGEGGEGGDGDADAAPEPATEEGGASADAQSEASTTDDVKAPAAFAAGGGGGAYRLSFKVKGRPPKVGRCKLDPGLKATGFKSSTR